MDLPGLAAGPLGQARPLLQAGIEVDEVERAADPGDAGDDVQPAHGHAQPFPQDRLHGRDPFPRLSARDPHAAIGARLIARRGEPGQARPASSNESKQWAGREADMAMLFENMQVFVRVVELGSLSAAGRHLRLSPAVVSHRLQQLENHLGVRLLNRTTRQVQPTEQGAAFYEACQEVLAAVAHAESVVADAGGTPQGNLRVTAPLGFGRRILAPLVPALLAALPAARRAPAPLGPPARSPARGGRRGDPAGRARRLQPDRPQDRRLPAPAVRRTAYLARARHAGAAGGPARPPVPAAALPRLAAVPLDAAHARRPRAVRRSRAGSTPTTATC